MCAACVLPALVSLVLLSAALQTQAAPLDDTFRNDGVSSKDPSMRHSAVYEAIRRSSSSNNNRQEQQPQQQPSVFLSISQTLAPSSSSKGVRALPVCLYPDELSRALEDGINTAFAGKLTQNASVDTTYTQKLSECSYSSFISYWGPADIATTLVQASRSKLLCDVLPRYCQALNIVSTAAAAKAAAAATRESQTQRRSSTTKTAAPGGSSSGWQTRRRSSAGPHTLLQASASADPDLPPVIHYNCQKHYFVQQLDHFATDAESPDARGDDDSSAGNDYYASPPPYHADHGEDEYSPDSSQGYADDDNQWEEDGGNANEQPPSSADSGKSQPHNHAHHRQHDYDKKARHVLPPPPWKIEKKLKKQKDKALKHAAKKGQTLSDSSNETATEAATEADVVGEWELQEQEEAELMQVVPTQQQQQQGAGARVKFGGSLRPAPNHFSPGAGSTGTGSSSSAATVDGQQALAGSVGRSFREIPRQLPRINQLPQQQQQQQLDGGKDDDMQEQGEESQQHQQEEQQQEDEEEEEQQQSPSRGTTLPRRSRRGGGSRSPNDDDSAAGGGRSPPQRQQRQPSDNVDEQQDLASQNLFKQVYWVCDAAWSSDTQTQRSAGNVVVFLGNEGPLGIPQQPIVFENARKLNALVILVEHRYYGESLPFKEPTDGPLPTEQYKWLDMSQVIEDTVSVVQHVRKEREVPAATPNIVVGGSYGGMLAAYHRLKRPDTFAAAVASSAPMQYIVNTPMWAESSNSYHQLIQSSADVMSGSTACSDAIRTGLARLLDVGISAPGRQQLAHTFRLCNASALDSKEAVDGLLREVLYQWQGFAQVNNQPPLLGQMALACQVLTTSLAAGSSPVEALAAVPAFFYSDGSAEWCYGFEFDSKRALVPGAGSAGYNSYSYQCCSQGTVYSSLLSAQSADGTTLNPEDLTVRAEEIEESCRSTFGEDMPAVRAPGYARAFMRLLRREGGVVFTNGDLDGWAGGSLGLSSPSSAAPAPSGAPDSRSSGGGDGQKEDTGADSGGKSSDEGNGDERHDHLDRNLHHEEDEDKEQGDGSEAHMKRAERSKRSRAAGARKANLQYYSEDEEDSGSEGRRPEGLQRVAFFTYTNASHCTDTHTYAWNTPGEPAEWKQQRAQAMAQAAEYANPARFT